MVWAPARSEIKTNAGEGPEKGPGVTKGLERFPYRDVMKILELPRSGRTEGVCQALEQRRSRQALRPTTWVQILTLQFKILLLPCQSYSASLSLRFLVCLRDDRAELTVVGIEWHRRVQHFMQGVTPIALPVGLPVHWEEAVSPDPADEGKSTSLCLEKFMWQLRKRRALSRRG